MTDTNHSAMNLKEIGDVTVSNRRNRLRRRQLAAAGTYQIELTAGDKVLLPQMTHFTVLSKRRYALMGRNGVGKTTLLEKLAAGELPGFPKDISIGYVTQMQEKLSSESDLTTLETLVESATGKRKAFIDAEIARLEAALDDVGEGETDSDFEEIEELSTRLGELDDELEELQGGALEERARRVLKGLGFSKARIACKARELSGGWLQRLSLSSVLLSKPKLLLLDEPTNHLDLNGVLWLENFILSENGPETLILVSHDRSFLNNVCTDLIIFANQSLTYFKGTLDEFEHAGAQKGADHAKRLISRVKKEENERKSIARMRQKAAKMKGKKGAAAQAKIMKQAKMKEAKIERIGYYDGKSKIGSGGNRKWERAEAAFSEKPEKFVFPKPDRLDLPHDDSALLNLSHVTCGYDEAAPILEDVSVSIPKNARIAIVGSNGAGKTTLIRLLLEELKQFKGEVLRQNGVRIAYVAQDHTKTLEPHAKKTPCEYLNELFGVSEQDARARLGRFGLTGKSSLVPMGLLSGGQKVRVSLTCITWTCPHLLFLDEPTNHLDVWALDALADALKAFEGAVVLVSHNRSFVGSFCHDLWVVRKKGVTAHKGDADKFAEIFSDYVDKVTKKVTGRMQKAKISIKASARNDRLSKASKTAAKLEKKMMKKLEKRGGGQKKQGAASIVLRNKMLKQRAGY